MRFDVEVNGRIRRVAVERAGGRFAVAVDDRHWVVDAARVDAHTLSMLVGLSSYNVSVVVDASGQLTLGVGPVVLAASLNGRRRRPRPGDSAQQGEGPQHLKAPMPGKVVRVLVKVGETVRARQPLVVVEAMKMENELRAAADGQVAELHVAEGQSVDAGALVAVVRPLDS